MWLKKIRKQLLETSACYVCKVNLSLFSLQLPEVGLPPRYGRASSQKCRSANILYMGEA